MKGIVLLFTCLLMAGFLNAQTLKMNVWPDKIPGAKKSTAYKEQTVTDNNRPRVSKVTDPELLVYLPPADKATGAAIVICPGGGYGRLAIDHEGYDVAAWLNTFGIAGIVLKYRLPADEIMNDKSAGPLQDVQEAIRIVRRKASEWRVDPAKVGVMGFSAGGHLAGTASTMYNDRVYTPADNTSARPDFSILVYGVLSMQPDITHKGSLHNLLGANPSQTTIDRFSNELRVDGQTPPAFLVHSTDDTVVPVENTLRYYDALKKNSIQAEMHVFRKGGHGYGMSVHGDTESMWPAMCLLWMQKNGWVTEVPDR